jgi:hypothetical protein
MAEQRAAALAVAPPSFLTSHRENAFGNTVSGKVLLTISNIFAVIH